MRPGSGSHPSLLRERSSSSGGIDLRQIIQRTSFVVIGGVATRLYMPERATLDVDVLVRASDLEAIERELRGAGAKRLGDLAIGGSSWKLSDGTFLDVVASPEPWVSAALAEPQSGPDALPYIALPYLVVTKLQVGRVQDIADLCRMLGAADAQTLDQVRRVVAECAPDAVEDVESLIELGRLELGDPADPKCAP